MKAMLWCGHVDVDASLVGKANTRSAFDMDIVERAIHSSGEIEKLCFKAEQISIQRGIKLYRSKGKESMMKEMKNLIVKNLYFREIKHTSLS